MIPAPPELDDLKAGHILVAGLSFSTVIADFDFETFSLAGYTWNSSKGYYDKLPGAREKSLPAVGAAVYAEHPDTEVLSLAYDLKDGKGRRLWRPGIDPKPLDLFKHLMLGNLIEAWNVSFERLIWENVCVRLYNFPTIHPKQLRCAMAKARAHALPGRLAAAGSVLKITNQKDKEGVRLLNKFSIPRKPTKHNATLRTLLTDDPVDAEALYRYNLRDIQAEAEISSLIPDLSPDELEFWQCDQEINHRGVAIDTTTLANAASIIQQAHKKYTQEIHSITGGQAKASEVKKLKAWLMEYGVHVPNLKEETVNEILSIDTLKPEVRRVLEIRQALSSASVKKVYSMINQCTKSGRLKNLLLYHGARTGRVTGTGPQPQNLPRSGPDITQCPNCKKYLSLTLNNCPWCGGIPPVISAKAEWCPEAVEQAIETINTGSLACVEYHWTDALETISGCLRGMFVAAPGHDLLCSDYSAIEAVVLAMLSDEQWRIDVFQTHGNIYEMSASKITGTNYQAYLDYKALHGISHPDRKLGKVAELASGYGGWIGAWVKFGADKHFAEWQIKEAILAWRKASPKIVEFWGGQQRGYWKQPTTSYYGLEGNIVQAILNPGVEFQYRGLTFLVKNKVLYLRLLSGRYLTYHSPQLNASDRRVGTYEISYETWNSNPSMGKVGWVRVTTYGGKLCENVVQATSRDLLAHAIVNLEHRGYPVVLHVHDEIVCEVPNGFGSVQELEKIMTDLPQWAQGWPIRAKGGWRAQRYKK
jgi:DNA polymerase